MCINVLFRPFVVIDDLETRTQRHLQHHVEEVACIAVQHDGQRLASACGPSDETSNMGEICLWDPVAGCCVQTLLYHVGEIGCLAFSANDRMLVSIGNYSDCAVAVWDVLSGVLLAASQSDWPINAVEWDPTSGNEFATVGEKGQLNFWLLSAETERPVLNVHAATVPEVLQGGGFTSLCYNANRVLVVGDNQGNVSLWDTEENSCVTSWPVESGEISSLFVRGDRLLTGGEAGTLKLWTMNGDAAQQEGLMLEDELPLDGPVTALSFDAVLEMGVVATASATIWYVDIPKRQTIRLVNSHTEQVTDLAFSRDEKFLASGSADGTVRVWSVVGKEQVMQFQLAGQSVNPVTCTCVDFSPGLCMQKVPLLLRERIWSFIIALVQILLTLMLRETCRQDELTVSTACVVTCRPDELTVSAACAVVYVCVAITDTRRCVAGFSDGALRIFDLNR